jgi:hypothetical protein
MTEWVGIDIIGPHAGLVLGFGQVEKVLLRLKRVDRPVSGLLGT